MGLNEKFFKSASGGGTPVGNENFAPVLYDSNGGTKIISNLNFAPDLVWIKPRDFSDNNNLFDTIRGATKVLISNGTSGESAQSNTLQEFRSDGFKLGGDNNTNPSGNKKLVAWCFKAGGSASSNIEGSITSQVSANTAAGFSIVKWTTSSQLDTVGHGLDSAPELIIGKGINWSSSWPVYALPVGNDKKMSLNDDIAAHTSTIWGDTTPTATTFKQDFTGTANRTSIAYCFHSVAGYQKIGSYTGTGQVGNTVNVGFTPRWVIIKSTSNGEPWFILDAVRNPSNPRNNRLMADSSAAEDAGSVHTVDFTGNNLIMNGTVGNGTNGDGVKYIYLAIA